MRREREGSLNFSEEQVWDYVVLRVMGKGRKIKRRDGILQFNYGTSAAKSAWDIFGMGFFGTGMPDYGHGMAWHGMAQQHQRGLYEIPLLLGWDSTNG